MLSLSVPSSPSAAADRLRPVNLRTDLGQVADLIELAFSDTMDSGGRAAVRELRMLSRLGPGLSLLASGNELTQGISLGHVWEHEGRIVGNVSIYPTSWPASLGSAWIVANVAVHPAHRRLGIARHLMEASLALIRQRGGTTAVLQVDADNEGARRLYERLGFVVERTWTTWRRSSGARAATSAAPDVYITRRRRADWRAEWQLAERVRPSARGGVGWLRPLHPGLFRASPLRALGDFFSLRSLERLVVYGADERRILASLWLETAFAASSVQLTLMTEPDCQGRCDEALVGLAVRRYGERQPLLIEHPADDNASAAVLERYHFRPQRRLTHMRWDVRGR